MNKRYVYVRCIEQPDWDLFLIDPMLDLDWFLAKWSNEKDADHYHAVYHVELQARMMANFCAITHGDHLIIY